MESFLRRSLYFLPFLSLLVLLLIFSYSTPLEAGPGGILVVFVLLYIFWASLFYLILHAGIRLFSRMIIRARNLNMREWQIGKRKSYYIASVLAFGPVLLLGMQSVGQLQLRDVGLVALLMVIAIFYVVKRV